MVHLIVPICFPYFSKGSSTRMEWILSLSRCFSTCWRELLPMSPRHSIGRWGETASVERRLGFDSPRFRIPRAFELLLLRGKCAVFSPGFDRSACSCAFGSSPCCRGDEFLGASDRPGFLQRFVRSCHEKRPRPSPLRLRLGGRDSLSLSPSPSSSYGRSLSTCRRMDCSNDAPAVFLAWHENMLTFSVSLKRSDGPVVIGPERDNSRNE